MIWSAHLLDAVFMNQAGQGVETEASSLAQLLHPLMAVFDMHYLGADYCVPVHHLSAFQTVTPVKMAVLLRHHFVFPGIIQGQVVQFASYYRHSLHFFHLSWVRRQIRMSHQKTVRVLRVSDGHYFKSLEN